jgi:hypothetical protein
MTVSSPPWGPLALAVARALVVRPWLWGAALAALARLAPGGWWRRWPPVPMPDRAYWHFRTVTAYGGEGEAVPSVDDVVDFLRWCRRTGRLGG